MDPPFENALRLIDIAIGRGYDVNVFAYEGAVYVPFALQKQHPNPVHGTPEAEDEDHPLPREWVSALFAAAEKKGKLFRANSGDSNCVSWNEAAISAPRCLSKFTPIVPTAQQQQLSAGYRL